MEKLVAETHVLPWNWKEEEDRISQLPEEILHRILDFSTNAKAAAKTCVLSKSWRYVWCTTPKLNFFKDSPSDVDKILQSYYDRNLCLEEFTLFMDASYENNNEDLTYKWIPIIIQDMHVKTLHLTLPKLIAPLTSYELPSLILESNHIRNLTLVGPRFTSSTTQPRVYLKHLQTLWLIMVYIPENILDSILSNCPLLECVTIEGCQGFTKIKLLTNNNNNNNLTSFSFHGWHDLDVSIEIGDHIRNLKTIELRERCLFQVSRNKPLEYACLTRLILTRVKLSSESFSCNLHSLEELKLDQCFGIKELKLSSRSMKFLDINNISRPFRATIDAPSMVDFIYDGILPQSISFAKTCSDDLWESEINLGSYCFNELYGLLEALSESKIYLALDKTEILQLWGQLNNINVGVSEEAKHHELPVVVEHLMIKSSERSINSPGDPFLYMLFYMFRPSFMYMSMDMTDINKEYREIVEFLFKERETKHSCIWQRVLEGASLEVLYQNQLKWQPDEYTSFTELSKKGENGELEFRIQLKWRA